MKIKGSRVGRKFQALIPDLLSEKERDEDRMNLQCGGSNPTTPIQSNPKDLSNPLNRRLNFLHHQNSSDRQYEQRIPSSCILNTNISISKEQYDRIVKGPRKRYIEALESKQKKFLNRRTGRRRVMRCQNYKEWDERVFSDDQSEGAGSPKQSELDLASTKDVPQQDKKRPRTSDEANLNRPKKRQLSVKSLTDVIDLVDLSDSPEVAHCLMQSQRVPLTIITPQRRKTKTVTTTSTRLEDDGGIKLHSGKGDSFGRQNGKSLPAVSLNVLATQSANTPNRQPLLASQRIIGRLSGFRPSSSNSTALIPVIEI